MLDADAKRRLHANPLRILDSKNPAMQEMIEGAPQLVDFIGDESRAHFEGLQTLLADAGLAYEINPRLVRGLDYYNRTVFEWVATSASWARRARSPAADATTACSRGSAASATSRAASRSASSA